MLFLICCGWLASGALGYCLVKRDLTSRWPMWQNHDMLLWSFMGVLFGPILFITGLIFLSWALLGKVLGEWFDKPSRW